MAGGPLAADIVKCQLKPVDVNDYAATFNETDALRLRKILAGGVCDWTQVGEGQTELKGSWLRFGNLSSAGLLQEVHQCSVTRLQRMCLTRVTMASRDVQKTLQRALAL